MRGLKSLLVFSSLVVAVTGAACNDSATPSGDVTNDTHTGDTTVTDTRPTDTTATDTATDSGPTDTTATDTTATDTAATDTTATDTTATDTTATDTTATDTTATDTAATDTATTETTVTDTSDTTDTETTGSCNYNGFVAVAQDAKDYSGEISYFAQSTTGSPVDGLSIETYTDLGGATAAGSFELKDENYADCGNCLLIYQGCDENLANCAKTFLAVGGTLDITTWGAVGEHFTGKLTGVNLVEVTIDDNYTSTKVEGGETWCLDSYDFDATIQ